MAWAYGLVLVLVHLLLNPLHSSVKGAEDPLKVLPDECIEGPYHKDTPTAETRDFLECRSWEKHSCCTVNVSDLIHHHQAEKLYKGYSWNLCGNLSAECEKFMKNEECFYQCEPMLYHFEHPDADSKGYIQNVPICRGYCDKYFEACKTDKTCVVDWLADFEKSGSKYICPADSTCKTFEETYKNGEGLCNKMWGVAFHYVDRNTDCFVMQFNSTKPNPNILRVGGHDFVTGVGDKPVFAPFLLYLTLFRLF